MEDSGLEQEVRARLAALARQDEDPADVADWAIEVMNRDDLEVGDPKVWTALDRLAGADLQSAPNVYLHSIQDFEEWLTDFESDLNQTGL
ncbi:hypothetical protein [Actinomadura sp. 6N118]|uniref:hypothetical protein n=1 Tax=Actinomadura sp. 6N118 TaxID=3375151 RepID=UPI00379401DC